MDNETKLSSQQINSLLNEVKGSCDKGASADDLIKKHLTNEQAENVKSILRDPEKLRQFLDSPFARRFINSVKDKTDGK